ncbi:aspartate aminotransferase family protein [Massilioclostridium coli]|uniref:aspartate aminotransferase family protein n=1 Tax=Massilioclostridium coli TaxID=1870991 RepID=UPI0022E09446|nr:aspartate aminotransferase family protein [Massilioclostridium coli]
MNPIDLKQKDKQYIANTYGRFDLCIEKGANATCKDYQDKFYIDFTSGIGVNSLGFSNQKWYTAVAKQAENLNHVSNLYYSEPCITLAEKLINRSGFSKVFFGNSGAEANEGAIKIARKYSYDKYGSGRSTIITLVNSFHGRTIATLEATGQEHFHQYFFPFTEGFRYAKANNLTDLQEKLDGSVCGIMCELIQGEGGVNPMEKDYIKAVEKLCKQNDIAFIVDEVQTGMGRTGSLLCCEQYDIHPNIVTLAKGLGGGLPIGAILMDEAYSSVLKPGDHGSTFGGNPIVCAGANVVMDYMTDSLFQQVKEKGHLIRKSLQDIPEVVGITGMGLMLGISLKNKKAGEVAVECMQNGLMVLTAKEKIRLLPPLTITESELEQGLEILIKVLTVS